VERRFARVLRGESPMPDLLLIDGGPGQLNAALAALDALGVQGLVVVAVAKRRRSQGRTGAPFLGRSGSAAYTCAGLAGVASDSAHSR
jgi:excinuclease UvrABC nuclease subunit